MAQEIKVAKILTRTGLKASLPQPLSPGEFGTALDTGEVFIGLNPTNTAANNALPIINCYASVVDSQTYANQLISTYLFQVDLSNPSITNTDIDLANDDNVTAGFTRRYVKVAGRLYISYEYKYTSSVLDIPVLPGTGLGAEALLSVATGISFVNNSLDLSLLGTYTWQDTSAIASLMNFAFTPSSGIKTGLVNVEQNLRLLTEVDLVSMQTENVPVISVNGIKNLQPIVNAVQYVTGFYTDTTVGGGQFKWDATVNKSLHNGGTVIAPEALAVWSGTPTDVYTMLNWTGAGNGCFVSIGYTVTPAMFGATANNNSKLCIEKSYAAAKSLGVKNIFEEMFLAESTVDIPSGASSEMIVGGIKAKTGFASNSPVIRLGNYSAGASGRWEGYAGTLNVDCNGTSAIGIDFNYTWKSCEVEHAQVMNHANIGIIHREGYGLKLKTYTIFAIAKRDGWANNAPYSSIGLYTETTDNYYGPCQVFGSFVGVKALGGNNEFENTHCWGIYKQAGTLEDMACPMGIPIWNQGQSNCWINPISDSPSMIDYSQPASESNGGYAIYNSLYGFQAKFIGATVFIPNRATEAYPVEKIVRFRCNHVATYIACEWFDDSPNKTVFTAEPFEGSLALQSCIVGRSKFDVYTADFPRFRRRLNCFKGIDIQTTYADADSKLNEYGIINFTMPDRKYLRINANYEGNVAQMRLQRQWRGTTGDRSFLATILGTDDAGYQLYLTDSKKLNIWDGTAWREANGTLI